MSKRRKVEFPPPPPMYFQYIDYPEEYEPVYRKYLRRCTKIADDALREIAKENGVDFDRHWEAVWGLAQYLIDVDRCSGRGRKAYDPIKVLLSVWRERQRHRTLEQAAESTPYSYRTFQTARAENPLLWKIIKAAPPGTVENWVSDLVSLAVKKTRK